MNPLREFTSTILTTIANLSKPNSVYIKDKHQLELCHRRYQALVIIHMISCIHFIINLAIGNGQRDSNIQGILSTLGICLVLFISNYMGLHPQIFNTIFNMHCLMFCVILQNKDDYGIFGAYLAIPVFPFFVYFLTGSITHFVIQNLCQIALLYGIYQDILRKSLAYMSVDETTKVLTYFTNQHTLYCILYTGLAHYALQNALYKVRVAERQKEDFERQKNFLLGFSHELRNLINSLMGNIKLASLEKLSDRVKDLLLNAEVCSELLLHLVNNILDTGKAEIGDLEVNPVPTRIYDVIERIWGVCSELIKRKNLSGRVRIQRDIPQVLILDHYRITQVFLNLVGNAIKFTDAGHINMTVEWIPYKESVDDKCFEPYPFNENNDHDEDLFEKSQAFSVFHEEFISLNFTRKKVDRKKLPNRVNFRKGVLKVSVIDTGTGIIKEDLGKLFQRFQQGTTNPSKKKLGTGLGLFITRELCQRMNGEVKVFSKPGIGSTFIFCLPMEPAASGEQGYFFDLEGVQRSLNYQQKPKAMIVDDEHFSQNVLRDFLRKLDVEVVALAEDGLVAYRKLVELIAKKEYINIVTMDINMSIMDGKMAAQKIRELEVEKKLEPCLLIMVSGNCGEAMIAECLDKNGRIRADAFIKKPVRIEELSSIITNEFMRKQRNRENSRLVTS